MSILNSKYDFNLSFSDLCQVRVVWYKYAGSLDLEKQIKNDLDKRTEFWFNLFDTDFDHFIDKIVEYLSTILPSHVKELSNICYTLNLDNVYTITLHNATGKLIVIDFQKKYDNKLRITE